MGRLSFPVAWKSTFHSSVQEHFLGTFYLVSTAFMWDTAVNETGEVFGFEELTCHQGSSRSEQVNRYDDFSLLGKQREETKSPSCRDRARSLPGQGKKLLVMFEKGSQGWCSALISAFGDHECCLTERL